MSRGKDFAMLWCPATVGKDSKEWTQKSIEEAISHFKSKYKTTPTVIVVRNPEKLARFADNVLKDITITPSNTIHDNYVAVATNHDGYFSPKITITYSGG